MSTVDKVRTMELLWDNLSGEGNKLKSPIWHGQVLADRKKAMLNGKEKSYGWDEAKKRIRKSI
jgi:hypothetical protein